MPRIDRKKRTAMQNIQQARLENLKNAEKPPEVPFKTSTGRRLVGVQSILRFVEQSNSHAKSCKKYRLSPCTEIQSGLDSNLRFQCFCGFVISLDSNDEGSTLPANKALAWGCQNSAIGYDAVSGLLSSLDLPSPSPNTYRKSQTECKDWIMASLQIELETAAEEEKKLAIEAEEFVIVKGIKYPAITVVVDGGWSKRSYGHSYNSNNGMAVIISARTNKVIFMGTRTKACDSCTKSKKEGIRIKHECFKNWSGSSCGMETDIILEGFTASVDCYGIVYNKFIGDGDSSVFSSIIDVYDGIKVEKIECINHIVRNFNTKLYDIAKNTVKGRNAADIPIQERRLVSSDFPRFGIAVRKSVDHYQQNKTSTSWKDLEHDLRNIPFHIFGQHYKCKKYFCDKVTTPEENKIPAFVKMNFWAPLQLALNRVVRLAKSLIEKKTTNPAENFMAVANKYIEGKRKNFGQSYHYPLRMAAAVFAFNHSTYWINAAFRMSSDEETSEQWQKHSALADAKRHRVRKAKAPRKVNFPTYKVKGDKDYGSNPTRPDIEDEQLAAEIEMLRLSLAVNEQQREEIFCKTSKQAESNDWFIERGKRITASYAGKIWKLRDTTDNTGLLNEIFGRNSYGGTKIAMEYGTRNEPLAITAYEVSKGLPNGTVQPSGLFISKEYGIFGASPDGLVGKCVVTLNGVQ